MNTCFIGAVSVQLVNFDVCPVAGFCNFTVFSIQVKIFQFHIVGECIEVTLTPKFEENFAISH